ncbi:MAG: NAD(P)H-binding protein [Aquificae bacterium]|nr:NAD(P)H-binding protein [Aquificota bacterium]
MRVFVAGATGFVGRYVVRKLLEEGHEVLVGTRNPEKAESIFGKGVKILKLDYLSKKEIKDALSGVKPEVVINLIGILYERPKEGETFFTAHYLTTKNLLEGAKEAKARKFILMSALGTHELAPSWYHQTKWWAERELKLSGIPYTIFRPSLILGPEQRLFFDLWRLTRYVRVVALPDWGRYPFAPVDVRDVACAFLRATEGELFGTYELCGTKEVSIKKLFSDIFSHWKRRVLTLPIPKSLAYLSGLLAQRILRDPPITADQVRMMWRPNVCPDNGSRIREICKREPIPYEESIKWSLENFDKIIKRK